MIILTLLVILPGKGDPDRSIDLPNDDHSFIFTDDFDEVVLSAKWMKGGYGKVGLDGNGNLAALDFDDRGVGGDWHGPWARVELPASTDYSISLFMDCIADGVSIARADLRVLDDRGAQIIAFSWRDTSISDSKSSITLYGRNDDDLLYSSPNDFELSFFQDTEVAIVNGRTGLTLEVGGDLKYTGPSEVDMMGFVELVFLKYQKRCISPEVRFDSITISSDPEPPPERPELAGAVPLPGVGIRIDPNPSTETENSSPRAYKIYRGASNSEIDYLTTMGASGPFIDRSVERGIRYRYRVSALDPAGESELSDILETAYIREPDPPSGLQAISGTDHVLLSWELPGMDGGDDITNITILRGHDTSDMVRIASIGPLREFEDQSVENDASYIYTVSASNYFGESVPSKAVSANIGSGPSKPTVPRNFEGMMMKGVPVLRWDPPLSSGNLDITGYSIRRESHLGGDTRLIQVIGRNQTFIDQEAEAGEIYEYNISCSNILGEGDRSDIVRILVQGSDIPFAPANLSINSSSEGISLLWGPPVGYEGPEIIGYIIFRGSYKEEPIPLVQVGNTDTFLDVDVFYGVEYRYKVSAVNELGIGKENGVVAASFPEPYPRKDPEEEDAGLLSLNSSLVYFISFIIGMSVFFLLLLRPGRNKKKDHANGKQMDG